MAMLKAAGLTNGAFINTVDAGTYQTSVSFLNANFTPDPLSYTSTFPDRFGNDQVTFRLVPNATVNDVQCNAVACKCGPVRVFQGFIN